MRAVFKVALNSIKKKKLQNILIMLIMIVAAVLFSISLNFILNADKPFDEIHSKLNGFDNILFLNPAREDVDKVVSAFKENSKVKEVSLSEGYDSLEYANVNGKKMKQQLKLQEKDDKNIGIDRLTTLQGDNGKCPKDGEVWISKGMADDNGIKLNDYVDFDVDGKKIKEKVGAIVVDPCFSQPLVGILRFWINKNELEKIVPKEDILKIVSTVFKSHADGNSVNLKVDDELGRPINGSRLTYDEIQQGSVMLYMIIGKVMFAISIFILIFTFVIIMITIVNTIFNDYKNIGIISSLGFTKFEVMLSYVVHFLVLAVLSSLVGSLIGSFASIKLLKRYFLDFGFSGVDINWGSTSLITAASIIGFVIVFSAIASISVVKVSPVQAIRQGSAPVSEKDRSFVSLMSLKKVNLFFSIGIKNIIGNLRQNFLLFIVICSAIFITSFCINSRNVLMNAYKNAECWGFEKSDLSMTVNPGVDKENVIKDEKNILNNSKIKSVTNMYYYSLVVMPKTNKLPSDYIYTFVYDNDFDKAGLLNVEGRNPHKKDEISISTKTGSKYNKGVGDYITFYINGKKKTFLITGTYSSIMHAGESIRMREDTVLDADDTFYSTIPQQVALRVKNQKDTESIIKELKNKYGNKYKIEYGNQILKSIGQASFDAAGYALLSIAVSFILIAVFCIFNLNLINIYSYKKDFGIFKSLGMTNTEINKIYVYKMLLLTALSILVTIPFGIFTNAPILNGILNSIGIRNLPVPMCFGYVFYACITLTVLIIAAVVISCRAVSGINGRELISE